MAAPDLHSERGEGVLAGINGEFLAGRIHLARQTTRFPNGRRILLDLLHARDRRGRDQSVSALNETDWLSAREPVAGIFKLRHFGVFTCVSVGGFQLWALPVSLPRASVFYFRAVAQRRRSSVLPALRGGL